MTGLMDSIRRRGHYVFILRPRPYDAKRFLEHESARNFLYENQVALRGWNFPPVRPEALKNVQDHVFDDVDYAGMKEHYRLYLSGQFAYARALSVDWLEESRAGGWYSGPEIQPGTEYDVLALLYTITEAYLFAQRLTAATQPETIDIHMEMHGMDGRKLVLKEAGRFLRGDPVSTQKSWKFSENYHVHEIMEDSSEHALDAFRFTLRMFNYNEWNPRVWQQDQEKLLSKRI